MDITTFMILVILEIVLNLDNVLFISILLNDIDKKHYHLVKIAALSLAVVLRILLLICINTIISIKIGDIMLSNIIFALGGTFLIYQGATSLYMQNNAHKEINKKNKSSLAIIMNIILADLVFSLDSIITALGLSTDIELIAYVIIVTMVIIAIMMDSLIKILNKYVHLKRICIIFVMVIGLKLILASTGLHISKTYLYGSLLIISPAYLIIKYRTAG